jgi:hypothetical protein
MSKSACGAHTELSSNNAVRITRCSCGTLHVTLLASGVTVRMSPDVLRGAASGLKAAADKMGEQVEISSTGSTSIN